MSEKQTYIVEEFVTKQDVEDGGQYIACAMSNSEDKENGIYIKICSWDEKRNHEEFNQFLNRKVRVTIETID